MAVLWVASLPDLEIDDLYQGSNRMLMYHVDRSLFGPSLTPDMRRSVGMSLVPASRSVLLRIVLLLAVKQIRDQPVGPVLVAFGCSPVAAIDRTLSASFFPNDWLSLLRRALP